MKNIFFKISVLVSICLPQAMACMDPGAKILPVKEILTSYKSVGGFNTCVGKLKAVGVKLSSALVYKKDRDADSTDPVIYRLAFTGKDSNGAQVRLLLAYDLRHHGFTCTEGVSYRIPRGGCF
jgi:hypothetical protein